jgi:hypothetical protein
MILAYFASKPEGPNVGDVYQDADTGKFLVYNDGGWGEVLNLRVTIDGKNIEVIPPEESEKR